MEAEPINPLPHPRIVTVTLPATPSAPTAPYSHPPSPGNSIRHSLHSPGSPSNDHSPSAQARHQLTRPLSPDLPTRDALYLFCNFSSYMRSPQEGADGIKDNTDFHDTIRLLDFARMMSSNPHSNVHILHMKYRFQTPDQGLPATRQEKLSALNHTDDRGRRNMTVPQPFSTLHDAVIKVDYQDNGVFHPLPAQAVFQHISKMCQPPPRIIVISYVGSKATENHTSSIADWATTSTPPIYVFSPLETRLRERRSLSKALHHAIPISMYAWPVGASHASTPAASTDPAAPHRSHSTNNPTYSSSSSMTTPAKYSPGIRRASVDSRPLASPSMSRQAEYSPRTYPSDPVATLSILTDAHRSPSHSLAGPEAPGDRVPLWMLAPGASVLHGSTAASLGVKLSDFSAVNLERSIESGDKGSTPQNQTIESRVLGIRIPPEKKDKEKEVRETMRTPSVSRPPLDAHKRRSMSATPEPISRTGSAASIRITNPNGNKLELVQGLETIKQVKAFPTEHLTPPDQDPRRLSPPDRQPAAPLPLSQQSWPRTKSWPTTREKVPGWRRGRREVMEDALDEVGREDEMSVDSAGNLTLQMEYMGVDGPREVEKGGSSSIEDMIAGALRDDR